MNQPEISPQDAAGSEERDWRAIEEDVLARVKSVSHSIIERVRKVIDDTNSHLPFPTDSTGELPAVQ